MVNNPIIAKAYNSLSITDIKTKNLAKNPPNGGIPANEKKSIKKEKSIFPLTNLSLTILYYRLAICQCLVKQINL